MEKHKKIKGVNLGGWLVLEKWMTPELFDGVDAPDEYNLLLKKGSDASAMFKEHRETFITEADFKWLKDRGINTVRIPVGHWLFNGVKPYYPCIDYLDRALDWALKYQLDVLVDIHAAKGCQNAFDNGGLFGIMEWHLHKENIDNTIELVGQICKRYKDHKAFMGIQLLNEPRYDIPLDIVSDFYTRGYHEARKYIDDDKCIVLHDSFRLHQWKDFMQSLEYRNVIMDAHLYHVFEEDDPRRNIFDHIYKAAIQRKNYIEEMKPYFPIVVGEWSICIHRNTLDQLSGNEDYVHQAAYVALGHTQLLTYGISAGWFFWNYKLSHKSRLTHKGWDFRECIEKGWLPQSFD